MLNNYDETLARVSAINNRSIDGFGRVFVAQMTDREMAEETLTLLRGLSDGMTALMTQIGPVMEQMQNSPLMKMFR
jgi:hypothetical protein